MNLEKDRKPRPHEHNLMFLFCLCRHLCVQICVYLNRVCFQLTKYLPVDKFHMPWHQLLSNKICLVLVKLIGLHPKLETNLVMHSIINLTQWRFLSIAGEKKRGGCVGENMVVWLQEHRAETHHSCLIWWCLRWEQCGRAAGSDLSSPLCLWMCF